MEIIEKKTDELIPYENNPRKNDEAVPAVARSIKEFGFKVPIVIDGEGVVVCGHTRLMAAKKLGLESVPCVVADDLSEEQIRAFRIADNKTAELASFDKILLRGELSGLSEVPGFGDFIGKLFCEDLSRKYSTVLKPPIYTPKKESKPTVGELYNDAKRKELVGEIDAAGISGDIRDFLVEAASRFTVFRYDNIAEFYSHETDPKIRKAFERLFLVIADKETAIESGLFRLTKRMSRFLKNAE